MDRSGTRVGGAVCVAVMVVVGALGLLVASLLPNTVSAAGVVGVPTDLLRRWGEMGLLGGGVLLAGAMLAAYGEAVGRRQAVGEEW